MCNPTLLGPKAPFLKFLLELDCAAGSVLPSALDSEDSSTSGQVATHVWLRRTWTYLDGTGPRCLSDPQQHHRRSWSSLHRSSLWFLLLMRSHCYTALLPPSGRKRNFRLSLFHCYFYHLIVLLLVSRLRRPCPRVSRWWRQPPPLPPPLLQQLRVTSC